MKFDPGAPGSARAATPGRRSVKSGDYANEVAVGVVMALPPYPHSPRDYEEVIGVPFYGASENGFHPCEAMSLDTDPAHLSAMASAGTYIGISVGTGQTVREAARGAYKTLRKISNLDDAQSLGQDLAEYRRLGGDQ